MIHKNRWHARWRAKNRWQTKTWWNACITIMINNISWLTHLWMCPRCYRLELNLRGPAAHDCHGTKCVGCFIGRISTYGYTIQLTPKPSWSDRSLVSHGWPVAGDPMGSFFIWIWLLSKFTENHRGPLFPALQKQNGGTFHLLLKQDLWKTD